MYAPNHQPGAVPGAAGDVSFADSLEESMALDGSVDSLDDSESFASSVAS
jgi:hypothetical protein